MAIDKVKRAFIWMRNTLRIIDRTTLPGEILGDIRPSIDLFGWDRLAGDTQEELVQGADATNLVLLSAVPAGVMRYVIYASMSHTEGGNITLSMQVRLGASITPTDIAVQGSIKNVPVNPFRTSLDRNILLKPGEQLLARSVPTPGVGASLFLRYKFIDLDPGEYIRAM